MALWTAFTIGLFGSLHCIGMCGPIAMSLPYQASSRLKTAGNALLYNFGRIITYSLLGAVIGLLGQGVFFAGFQRWLAIGMGVLLLAIALFSINVESKMLSLPMVNRFYFRLKAELAKLLKRRSKFSLFWIGTLNGLIPCGLVWLAIIGAVSTGNIWEGMFYMMLFGLGTLPLMLTASLAGNWAGLRFRKVLRKMIPAFLLFFAMLFFFRGFNFYIPPDFNIWEAMQNIPMCH